MSKSEEFPKLTLSEIQRSMAEIIMNPLSTSQKTTKLLRNGEQVEKIARGIIKPNSRLSSFERIEIYNRQYWFRLIDCLYDDFPGLKAILGERRFYNLVIAYLSMHPSSSFSLRDLGSQMLKFLTIQPHWLGARKKIGLEMAAFEWAQVIAFDGATWPPLVLGDLGNAENLILHLQPYISVLELSYPLDDLIIALRHEKNHRAEASAEREASLNLDGRIPLPKRQKVFLVVHRFENTLYYKRIDRAAFFLLKSVEAGVTLDVACAKAIEAIPIKDRNSSAISNLFREWFETWAKLHWFALPPS